jgi:hypothetical protein
MAWRGQWDISSCEPFKILTEPVEFHSWTVGFLPGSTGSTMTLGRTHSDPLASSVPISSWRPLDPDLRVSRGRALPRSIGDSLGNTTFSATVLAGICRGFLWFWEAWLSYLKTRRTTEIGVRID